MLRSPLTPHHRRRQPDYNTKPRFYQINTAIVGITPEVQEFNNYTPFNKPSSILNLLRALPADDSSSP